MTSLFDELKWRGLLQDHTEGLPELLAKDKVVAYIGFDPTASSLHVGSLLTVLGLARLQRFGHTPIAIVGGGTGMIGDPSGKSEERNLLSREQVDANVAAIRPQLEQFLDFDSAPNAARIVNNADWLGSIDVLSFLREIGKHFTVNYMLEKESVKRRLEGEEGISYTEFSYLMLQAYDYLQLFDRFGCSLQMGGSDQWGNITAGTELIRKLRAKKAHGLVWPLLKTSSGTKFGKTETGTIWLDPKRTPPFRFYQFWLNSSDQDVEAYFKYFTEWPQTRIEEVMREVPNAGDARYRQRILARELTTIVHGPAQAERAERGSAVMFTEDVAGIPLEDVLSVFDDVPSTALSIDELNSDGMALVDLIVRVALAPSKSEARRLIQSGGVYVNNRRTSDPQARVTRDQAIGGVLVILRKGQKETHLVRLT